MSAEECSVCLFARQQGLGDACTAHSGQRFQLGSWTWTCPGCHAVQTGPDKGICDGCKAYETSHNSGGES